ncbi:hypothetical protein CSOJ01_08950 [Colletotrichum sojae]|uniref:Uncharacterized protein n=1 Tax=Colletotrichum sojae TaxID=2175907 RepID=A0A8H6J518_9PEZI|nr:hypothetical protein CSOJ01_08950 [Colletotrichum sojae]
MSDNGSARAHGDADSQPQPAVLGIDWGSTAIRASLFFRESEKLVTVWNENTIPAHDERYQEGAYNSTLFLDDNGEPYLGEDVLGENRKEVSSKMYFTRTRQTSNPLIDEAVRHRRANGGDAEVRELERRIRHGMQSILRTVFRDIQELSRYGEHGPFCIDAIALSYPEHWTSEERGTYEDLLNAVMPEFRVLADVGDDIFFHEESLAMAHNAFRNSKHIQTVLEDTSLQKPTLMLFLDFGGHAMNGCMFSVVRRGVDDLSYALVGKSFSAHGGTQVWEHMVAKYAEEYSNEILHLQLTPKQRAEVLQDFHVMIKKMKVWKTLYMHAPNTNGVQEDIEISINPKRIEQCFWSALKGPVDLACEQIKLAATLDRDVRVVLSGGSGKFFAVQERLHQACAQEGLRFDLIPFYRTAGDRESWSISKGAALASARMRSVDDFITSGAAFGLQLGYLARPDESDVCGWQSLSYLLFDRIGSHPTRLHVEADTKMRIVCSPILQAGEEWDFIPSTSCYNIIELPFFSQGHWNFTLSRYTNRDETGIKILARKLFKKSRNSRWLPTQIKWVTNLPLYFDPSSRCCLPKSDVEDFGRGLALDEDGVIIACSPSVVEDQLRNWGEKPPAGRRRKAPASAIRRSTGHANKRARTSGVKPSGHLPVLTRESFQPKPVPTTYSKRVVRRAPPPRSSYDEEDESVYSVPESDLEEEEQQQPARRQPTGANVGYRRSGVMNMADMIDMSNRPRQRPGV